MLEDLFYYCDLSVIAQTNDDRVLIECVVRKTGAVIFVEGEDLDDAIDLAMRQVMDQVYTIDAILKEFGLTIEELRTLVDFHPTTSQYEPAYGSAYDEWDDYEDFLPPPVQTDDRYTVLEDEDSYTVTAKPSPAETILAMPLMDLVAAQPFIAIDKDTDDLYLALRLPRPSELDCED